MLKCRRLAVPPSVSFGEGPQSNGSVAAALLAERAAKYRRARASAGSHRTEAKMDPRTELTPIGRRQAWTAFRAAASRQNGPPVQYQRQRQLLQLQQDIRSSWRWFLHRPHGLTRTLSEMVPERASDLVCNRGLALLTAASTRHAAAAAIGHCKNFP